MNVISTYDHKTRPRETCGRAFISGDIMSRFEEDRGEWQERAFVGPRIRELRIGPDGEYVTDADGYMLLFPVPDFKPPKGLARQSRRGDHGEV